VVPAVSVIVPNYNHARFLDRRIQSVLGQTFQDIEVIFLDDASTDQSIEVFARYAGDPRVRSAFNSVNSGSPFLQWNKGIALTSGAYIWIAESDDDADPRFLETLVCKLAQRPQAVLACCDAWRMDEAGTPLWRNEACLRYVHPTHWQQDYVNSGTDEVAQYMVVTNTIPNASGVVFRREAWERAGPVPAGWRLSGDWFQWVRMLAQGDLVYVSEPMNRFRQHRATIRASAAKSGVYAAEFYRVLRYIRTHFRVSDDRYEVACEKCFRDWCDLGWQMRHERGGWPLRQTCLLLITAWKADSRILSRLCRHAMEAARSRLSGSAEKSGLAL
jgi:glycosyltransferase involved in cell wall biosynthesis